jgi:hypothetical protein
VKLARGSEQAESPERGILFHRVLAKLRIRRRIVAAYKPPSGLDLPSPKLAILKIVNSVLTLGCDSGSAAWSCLAVGHCFTAPCEEAADSRPERISDSGIASAASVKILQAPLKTAFFKTGNTGPR